MTTLWIGTVASPLLAPPPLQISHHRGRRFIVRAGTPIEARTKLEALNERLHTTTPLWGPHEQLVIESLGWDGDVAEVN